MANTLTLRTGQTVKTNDGREGVIRFIGTGSFATGEWIGLELPENKGKNDGSVKGQRYFQCAPGHGLFLRRNTIKTVTKQPRSSFTKPPSKSRSSSTSSGSSNAKTGAPPSLKGGTPPDKTGAPPAPKTRTPPEKQVTDVVSEAEGLRRDNDRLKKHIIPILEDKLKSSKKEISELRKQNSELEAKAASEDASVAANTADLEMATMDKEIAEQRAENLAAELEEVKFRNEELVTDLELLKEETFQLATTASPDERASLSQHKLEHERKVMHDAVTKFRELTKENDIELKSQIQELQTELAHAQKFKVKYEHVQEKLAKAEASNQHLLEQLDAAETQEEVMLRLELQKQEELARYERLDRNYQELVEVAQINNELETVHMKDRHELFNEVERTHTLLDERERTIEEQDRTIQDLQYVLVKFRDTVHTLQHNNATKLDHNVADEKSDELNSKDRSALDLNLSLATQAADRMKRDIDYRITDNALVQANDKVEILGHFVMNGYDDEVKTPVTLMHRMRKVREDSSLVLNFFRIRVRMLGLMSDEERLDAFEITEDMCRINVACERFDSYMVSCSVADFSRMTAISADLASVEKAVDGWVYLLRENNMGKAKSEDLHRMPVVLEDLAEKFIGRSPASHNVELIATTSMIENHLYSVLGQFELLRQTVTMHCGTKAEDEYDHFLARLESELAVKARRARFMAEQLVRGLREMQERSIGLLEQAWDAFVALDTSSKQLSQLVRAVARAVVEFTNDNWNKSLTLAAVEEVMTSTAKAFLQEHSTARDEQADDVSSIFDSQLQRLHERLSNAHATARDLSFIVDVEKAPHPWLVRAEEFKAQNAISAEVHKELNHLKTKIQEQQLQLTSYETREAELKVMVDHLRSRTKDVAGDKAKLQRYKTELDRKSEEATIHLIQLVDLRRALETLEGRYEKLKVDTTQELGAGPSRLALDSLDGLRARGTYAEQTRLRLELEATQANVRQIKFEAYWAGLPLSDVQKAGEKAAWLHVSELRFTNIVNHEVSYQNETRSMFKELLGLADRLPATALEGPPAPKKVESGRATARLPVMRQRGQVARWEGKREESVRKGKLAPRQVRPWRV